jgi:bacillaene synthase trans-acting acyltransferase
MDTVFMFSGQGSQYFQMGKALFDQDAPFRDSMLRLDAVARDLSGNSLVETLYSTASNKSARFDRTLLTHPAIFMVEYSLAQSLMRSGVMPDCTLGASLGSFAAAAVAGFIDAEDALAAVIRQANILEACCEPGGMLAVLGDPSLLAETFLSDNAELAAVNFSTHFVVSAKRSELAEIELGLKTRNVTFQQLPVSFAFHSQWVDAAKAPFEEFLHSVRVRKGQLPLLCCDRAEFLAELPQNYFWNVTRHPIRFREAIAQLERSGSYRYVDVGPAGTLATFLKYGLPPNSASKVHSILTPYGRDVQNFAALTGQA